MNNIGDGEWKYMGKEELIVDEKKKKKDNRVPMFNSVVILTAHFIISLRACERVAV